MTSANQNYVGRWLHQGEKYGQDFDHTSAEYEHGDSSADTGATSMRHAVVERQGTEVGVGVPADWTDDQAREALDSNW